MQCEVVDLAEVRSGTDNVGTVNEEVSTQYLNETRYVLRATARGNLRIKFGRNGFPSGFLKDSDDLRGLFYLSAKR